MRQHFILCGLGKVGWRVLEQLRAAGTPIVAIDNHCAPDDPRLAGTPLIQGDCRHADVLVTPAAPLVGRRLSDVARQHEVALVAHLPAGQPPRVLNDVLPDVMLAPGDRLIVCGPPEKLAPLLAGGDADSLPQLLWANIVKRFSRVFARLVVQVEWPVKICTGIFFSVLLISMLVFHFGMKDDSLVDAFYRTIS